MNARAKILCVSSDPVFLQTRRWILEGYFQVECAGRLPEVAAMIESQSYDLILLCYSLRAEECRQIHSLVRTRSPQAQILALTEGSGGCAEAYSDSQMPVGDGPYALLKRAAVLIAPQLSRQIRSKRRNAADDLLATLPVVEVKPPASSIADSIGALRAKLH